MKVLLAIFSFVSCFAIIRTQTGLSSYLPPYSAVNQHSFVPPEPSSFGMYTFSSHGEAEGEVIPTTAVLTQQYLQMPFTGPTAYPVSGFSPPLKYYGSFKNTYTRPKVFAVLSHKYAIPTTGYEMSKIKRFQEEHHHAPAQYEFEYKVHDPHYGAEFGHAETRHGHIAKGQYMVLLPDGRRQIVDYVADSHGYRPTIRYEGGHQKISYGR